MIKIEALETYVNTLAFGTPLDRWLYLDILLMHEICGFESLITTEVIRNYFQLCAYLDYKYSELCLDFEAILVTPLVIDGKEQALNVWLALYNSMQSSNAIAPDFELNSLKRHLSFYTTWIRPTLHNRVRLFVDESKTLA